MSLPARVPARGAAAAAAHELAEHLVEDVAEAAAGREVEAAANPPGRRPARRPRGRTVVGGALLVVLQDVVGLVDLLEPRLGLLVAGIAVRVVLHGELAIGLLQVVRARLPRHAQGGVVVLLRHFSPSLPALQREARARLR